MSDAIMAAPAGVGGDRPHRPQLDSKPHFATGVIFFAILLGGLAFTIHSLRSDMAETGAEPLAIGAFVLLGVALLVALAFEFVNGFHDTANAVATVIYTHSLPPTVAVIWSGFFNFLGVLLSAGGVAFGIINLLPVELILQVGSGAGFAMIFALLIAAIIWNLGTWALGLPASSSHTLIGSIIGVGLANQLLAPAGTATSGVDWTQATSTFEALLLSPLVGFLAAAGLLLTMRALVRRRDLYEAPTADSKPPVWIRGLLILTCTGVSFAHGSNDGQKGMGLIMLILIGALPTAYALNRAVPESATPAFLQTASEARQVFDTRAGGPLPPAAGAREATAAALRDRTPASPAGFAALSALTEDVSRQVRDYGSIQRIPAAATQNVRNDMYLVSDTIRGLKKQGVAFDAAETARLTAYQRALDDATKFIPTWVKISVALALGLGTMVGWKRIVVTVGEKIGKTHMTYAQGASAEMVAAITIAAADMYHLPVSTTHVLSSGVAGTMAANGSGLQWSTVRSLLMAWVLTLPAAILLAGCLYALLRQVM
ncbi:inorganic phosphate transporter [Pararoseomonas indoligenes]|uniref:Phosphate transporter n=1 Tax=Roseomonas indoligenes TaxID=2820811 RepID=A0A940MUP6_9PROT|nr:inorganic phosphate transporter [Pararoseomonas indoligenes]MBP0493774.1 inorganic phosphate transporter [Pararoseomonas indoligenes]